MSRFLRRLISAVAMWAIALAVIFTGNEVVFFLLIAVLGLAGLWEYFQMIEKSGMRCFKAFGMCCGAAYFVGSFLFFRSNGTDADSNFETLVLLVFLFGVLLVKCFDLARSKHLWRPWPTLCLGCSMFPGCSIS